VGKLFLKSFLEGSIQIIHKFWPIPEAGIYLVVRLEKALNGIPPIRVSIIILFKMALRYSFAS
jgi:hypothetical protein